MDSQGHIRSIEDPVVRREYVKLTAAQWRALYHFHTQDGREVDLLIELPQGYYAFEIKMADRVNAAAARHLKSLQEFLDKPLFACPTGSRRRGASRTILDVVAQCNYIAIKAVLEMASLTLRNIPNGILDRIRLLSEADRRSLNNEILIILETA